MNAEGIEVALTSRFWDGVAIDDAFGTVSATVPPDRWVEALTFARDDLGCAFFDWLTGVDELDDGFTVVVHLYAPDGGHRLLLRTRVRHDDPRLATATGVYRGANWHERETAEMFGIVFDGHPNPVPLLLPDGFEGYPLRKEFVLASRVAKTWPGAETAGRRPSERPPRGIPPEGGVEGGDV